MDKAVKVLESGDVAVLPTDTIYGLHALALNNQAVEKIYGLKGRDDQKPLIVLISSVRDLEIFGVKLSSRERELLDKLWPNPVSVILPVDEKWDYLHRGSNTLAFRMPNKDGLLGLINRVGPLVSTSTNPSGEKPAETVEEAKEYFGDRIGFYQDSGKMPIIPSTVIRLTDGKLEVIRQGVFNLSISTE